MELTEAHPEKAILVGIYPSKSQRLSEEQSLQELEELTCSAGAHVVRVFLQERARPDPAYLVGIGKLEEIRDFALNLQANLVVFDVDLTPAQVRNLERFLGIKIIDRTELILDIFSQRARSREGKLQVELAQLEYSLPRLKRMWTHLSRLNMGIGMRGPGEKQLEVDRRLVEKRISDLRGELKSIEKRKERHRIRTGPFTRSPGAIPARRAAGRQSHQSTPAMQMNDAIGSCRPTAQQSARTIRQVCFQ